MRTETPTLAGSGVSDRESEVLDLLGEHLTNAEIAARLFISVRTVESHVSSLLRKLDVADRRALAELAEGLRSSAGAAAGGGPGGAARPVLPAPLTSFVGREAERAALAEAVEGHRLVTAVGPGGIGKTRLALAVAADLADRFDDGVWYVDLVPVTDPAMIASAVANVLGLGDQSGRSIEDTVFEHLATAHALLVLDNCEHQVDALVVFVERLLTASPRSVVLATSQARLLAPFESVFPVAGLSLRGGDDGPGDDGPGDAVTLFLERAAAVGSPPLADADLPRVAAVCAQLDGMALAIELAAARLPTLGLDGLEAGLSDRLDLLAGRARVDDRHSSLRAAIDWSFALLAPPEQAVLRRVSVFAAPFRADDAAEVAGFAPIDGADVARSLAVLADQSLLVVLPGDGGTRYRALETIRQYGVAAMDEAGELDETHRRHLRWSLAAAHDLQDAIAGHGSAIPPADWVQAFDTIADDLRAALGWAAGQPGCRADAHALASLLGDLGFARGHTGESQRRYLQAAELADDDVATITALRQAATAAQSRHLGDESLRLTREAADLALRTGHHELAGIALAHAAMLVQRCPGTLSHVPSDDELDAMLTQARALTASLPRPSDRLHATLLVAEAFRHEERDPVTLLLAERAQELGRRLGSAELESAALDSLTSVLLAIGDAPAAAAVAHERTALLATVPYTADIGFELPDALQMANETSVAVGDLQTAREVGERILALPLYHGEGHLATPRLLVVEALAGNWDRVHELARRFRERWLRAGSPTTSNLAMGASAVAMVHGLEGDDAGYDEWSAITRELRAALIYRYGEGVRANPAFEAIVLLHRGDVEAALDVLSDDPVSFRAWHSGRLRQWYAGVWAEAAVLAGHAAATDRVARARMITMHNPIARALVARAALLLDPPGDARSSQLVAVAAALEDAGCHYQAARTRVFAGGDASTEGEAALERMGATAMAVPPAAQDP